jgi:hypothetical protein
MPTPSDPDLRRQIKARLLALPPRAFELFAGDLLEFMGLRNVLVTRYSGDGGIDAIGSLETSAALISIPTGVQVKRYRTNVQRADIDRFIGALSGQYPQGVFITTAGYTRQAALKAVAGIPRVATVDGDQVVALMLRHHLGIAELAGAASKLDEEYFSQFEAQVAARPRRVDERPEAYRVGTEAEVGHAPRPEDDLISLRALSHALRVDTAVLGRWMEKGQLRPEQSGSVRAGRLLLPPRSGRGDPPTNQIAQIIIVIRRALPTSEHGDDFPGLINAVTITGFGRRTAHRVPPDSARIGWKLRALERNCIQAQARYANIRSS